MDNDGTTTILRPGRSYCVAVESYDCEAPAGFRTGRGYASCSGVRRADLLTCGYCAEAVCRECVSWMQPPEFFSDQSQVPVCLSHDEGELLMWLGL